MVRSDSLPVQLAVAKASVGVVLAPEPSVEHYGLVVVKTSATLREEAASMPSDELFLVTHRALRDVPRIRAVWDAIVAKMAERPKR